MQKEREAHRKMSKYFTRDKFHYCFRVLSHPLDAFYEIRHRERGSVPISLILVAIFSICYSMNRLCSSFIVNDVDPRDVDSPHEMLAIFMLVLLFSVGNWSITCLMNGEGRFKDIVTVVGYSLMPMIITYIPAIILSQFMSLNESGFYSLIMIVGTAWTVLLILVGIMTVHNYSLLKTIVTLILSVIAILIILFIMLLLSDLVSQVYSFFHSIYLELVFRS
jgi:hypothetical protein